MTDLIIGAGSEPSSPDSAQSPLPVQSIGIKILALVHLFFSKFSFQVDDEGSPIPKAD